MAAGTIKKVIADRGFGFISAEDEKEYFFHRSGVDPSLDFDRLVGGEQVEFEVEASPKGHAPSRCAPPEHLKGPPMAGHSRSSPASAIPIRREP